MAWSVLAAAMSPMACGGAVLLLCSSSLEMEGVKEGALGFGLVFPIRRGP